MILIWKKGTRVLTAGEIKVKRDDHVDLKGTDLKINSVAEEDGGKYSCEIEADSEYPIVITHTVEVLVPPRLTVEPSSGKIVVRSGTTVALKCKVASGNPPPAIVWRKKNDRLPTTAHTTDEGMTLTMSGVTRHHSGIFECEADNGVGRSVKAEISLNVMYEPDVSSEHPVVHGGLDKSAELSCLIYADPEPEVIWYRETMRLDPNGKRYMESRGSRHTLIVRRVEKEDFANYSCYAANSLGKSRAYLTLRGNPSPPVFNSQVLSKSQTSYKISWITESYEPIEEYRLLYRKLPSESGVRSLGGRGDGSSSSGPSSSHHAGGPADVTHAWHNLRLPPREMIPGGPKSNLFQEAYTLGPLVPDSSYEAKVSSKNKYGWSEVSQIFQFYTQGKGTSPNQNFVKKPDVQDLGLSSSAAVDSSAAISSSSSNSSSNSFRAYPIFIAFITRLMMFLACSN